MKLEQKRVHETLVNRLRTPLNISDTSDRVESIIRAAAKLDAIGEALAYLIDKKHAKRKDKVSRKKREA